MFMTPAITNVNRGSDSGFGLMHLNALNGSASIESGFGPRNFVNDEHVSAKFFDNFNYYPKETLKSPSMSRLRATSPIPSLPRSKARSPYMPRKTKANKYEVEFTVSGDELMERNLLKNNVTQIKVKVTECCKVDNELRSLNASPSDVRVSKCLDFDSLSLYSSPCKENKKLSKKDKKQNKHHLK